jgi:hypothetical protein
VHGDAGIFDDAGALVLRSPGRAEQRYPGLWGYGRMSPSGDFVLGVTNDRRHTAAIVDVGTGELWRIPNDAHPWIAWSYADIAMVDHVDGELLACDALRGACDPLPAEQPLLMPTN